MNKRLPRGHSGLPPSEQAGRVATAKALERMTREDPELATRLFLQMLPAAAQRLEGPLSYDLEIDRLGTWRVKVDGDGGGARVERLRADADANGDVDFTI